MRTAHGDYAHGVHRAVGMHGDSAVNAAWTGRYIDDDPPRSHNTRGTFAFSYEGPGKERTRNTQIYVNVRDAIVDYLPCATND